MLINEIAKRGDTTKKAVQYYVEQGLLSPRVLENGYKDFSERDLAILKKIVLYRRLGLNLIEIKRVLKNQEEIKSILYQKTMEIEKEKARQELLKRIATGENVENLEGEINNINSNSIIIKKLMDLFPSYYGKFISLNFARYLTGEVETEEQKEAFSQMIEFFDSVPDMNLPPELQEYLEQYLEFYSSEEGVDSINQILQSKDKAMQDIDMFVKDNKELLDEYYKMRQTNEFKSSPAFQLMEYMKQFCITSGYYDLFIPAMRRLSPLYNEYYEQMLEANDRLKKMHPEYIV